MLDLRDITKRYNGQGGVEGVSLFAPAGSRTVIVGPSGSGKTTLLRAIAGFEAPDSGSITLSGRTLHSSDQTLPPHLRKIAYVAQEGALFPHMSVADNVGFALPRKTEGRRQQIDTLLAKVGLAASMRDRRPHELSGGQQQRVALARALAQKPSLMLLDEPFSALDTGLREAMRTMVGDVLREAGITTVLVTHDQAEALAFADHLVVMRDGCVADAGPPQRLYEKPADIETAQFLGEAIILSGPIRDGIAKTALGDVFVQHGDVEAASILVRPHQISVTRQPSSGAEGRIVHCAYRGSSWRLELDCGPMLPPFALDVTAHDFEPGAVVWLNVAGTAHVFSKT